MTTTPRFWLTDQAFDRLQRELDHLLGPSAAEEHMEPSASADFDQGPVVDADRRTARIKQIQNVLHHAAVGATPADDGVAEPGMVLTVRFDDADESLTFLLGTREATDRVQVYSPNSPLGAALCGAREGEQRTYTAPSGAVIRVSLLRAVPYGHHMQPTSSERGA